MRNKSVGIAGLILLMVLSSCVNLRKVDRKWDAPPYFALEHQTEIDGIKIVYLECGRDEPETLIFIHGLSGNIMNWWDQFEYFRDDYHILIPDLPGHGKSDKPDSFDYTVPSFAKIIVELMRKLGIDKANIIGNSLGGAIAGYIAIHYPEQVDKLVLSDSAGTKISPELSALSPFITPLTIRWSGVTSGRQYPGTDEKNQRRAEFSASYRNTTEELPYLKAIDQTFSQLIHFDFTEDLSRIKAPTLIIWGDNDKVVPFKTHKIFTEKIPDHQLYVVKKGDHTPNMTRPEEFNCALEKFLKNQNLEPCYEISESSWEEK